MHVGFASQLDNIMIDDENERNEIEGERPAHDNYDDSFFDLSQISEKSKLLYRTGKFFLPVKNRYICPNSVQKEEN